MIDIDFIAYSIIDEKLALNMCKRLDIISLTLSSSRSVREYDERLTSYQITYAIYSTIIIDEHVKHTTFMLMTKLESNRIILEKL